VNDAPCVADLLAQARAAGVDRLDAQLLLARLLARPRTWLLAHDDATLDPPQLSAWNSLLARRAAGEPLAYLLGEKEFRGLLLQVNADVLVPRPETEILVDWSIELLNGALRDRSPQRVADLGTGSGAIAIAVKHACPVAQVSATDASAAALDVARANALALGVTISFAAGSWWDALEDARFDLVLSNPPYVAAADPHLAALRHEPHAALTPGGDGLDALRQIIAGAPEHLGPGAWLLVEHGYDQAHAVQALLATHGFGEIATRADLAGQPRCTGGCHR
jgi:release factor glutamine methyltransferase